MPKFRVPRHVWRGEAEPVRRRIGPLRRLLCALPGLLVAATAVAQGPVQHADEIFEHLDRDNGLLSPIVQALAQDGHGFLWVGTGSGVARWDGYHFRNYVFQVGVSGALPDNNVYSMYTDPAGTLWVGTMSRGVARYDPVRDAFQTFVPPGKDQTFATVYSLVSDGKNGVLVGSRQGLDDLDPATGTFTRVALRGATGRIAVVTMVRDRSGRVWAGTTQGLFRSDRRGRHFTALPVFGAAKVGIWRMLFDHEGRLWIGTIAGAYVLEPGEQTARPIHETTPGRSLLDKESIDAICEAAPGVIWMGTLGQGIVAVDAKTLETHRIVHDAAYPTSLASDTVVTLLTDRAGSVWVGTTNGVGRAEPGGGIRTFFGATGAPGQSGRIADEDVTDVLPAGNGQLWLGLKQGGVELIGLAGGTVRPVRQITAGMQAPLPAGEVNSLAEGPDGSLYVGTANWVYRIDGGVRKPVALPQPQETGIRVDALLVDGGTLWIGSHKGLWKEDLPAGAAPRDPPEPVALPLSSPEINVLARGSGNDLWVGTAVELVRYDMAKDTIERIPVDPADPHALPAAVTSLLLDGQHRLWVTTWGGGVCVLEGRDAGGKPEIRRLSEGLPDTSTDDVLEAPDGKIWVSTDNGFAVIDPETFAITPLRQAEGVAIPAYWVHAGANSADGRLIFGGDGGLTVIDPARVKAAGEAGAVVVTDILAGGKPSAPDLFNGGEGDPVLRIPHDENSVAVEFASLDYAGPDSDLYAYKLDGFDQEWNATPSTRRVASYTNLPPGDYTLELRGSNRDGIWGPVRRMRIEVVPAWFQTLWARLGAGLLVLLALGAAWRTSTAYLRARQRELERRVELRTAELKKITEELEASRFQLELMAHSDALTGLPNRRRFSDYFRRILATSRRQENGSFTLMLFDLDKFKEINDAYGHDAGDAWLKMVAERVSGVVRESDCFARLGGDEFAVLVADPIDENGIATLCRALAASVKDPFLVDGAVLNTTFSIGVATCPQDGEEEATLFKAADVALYRVKRAGGNGWQRAPGADVRVSGERVG